LNHKNLDVWQLALKFVSFIYQVTSKYAKEEIFEFTNTKWDWWKNKWIIC